MSPRRLLLHCARTSAVRRSAVGIKQVRALHAAGDANHALRHNQDQPNRRPQPTPSEEATRAEHVADDPAALQRKTVETARRAQGEDEARRDPTGATAKTAAAESTAKSTASEEATKGERHDKSPKQLQREETAKSRRIS